MEKAEIEKLIADAIEAIKPMSQPLGKWTYDDAEQNKMVVREITGIMSQMTRHYPDDMSIVREFNDRLYSFLKTELQHHWE